MIKVRAWHKALKCFVGGDHHPWHQYGPQLINGELSSEDHDIELFIGLQDIKGKEMYAGDIFDSILFPDDDNCPSQIIFEDGSFRYKHNNWPEKLPGLVLMQRDIDLMNWSVIGNIHENPELIGGGS